MRDILWQSLVSAKHNGEYTCLLLAKQRIWLNRFNILIATCSAGGVMGWKFWEAIPAIACVIIAAVSLLKLLQPHLVPSDKQIQNLDKINDFYFDHFLKLQNLWFEFEYNIIDEIQAMTKYQELKQTEREINSITNEVHKQEKQKLNRKAKEICDQYFKLNYNTYYGKSTETGDSAAA